MLSVMSLRNWAVLFALASVACMAQDVSQAQPPCDQQRIVVTVTDDAGKPLTGLTAANFRAQEHGRRIQVVSVTAKSNPAMVMFLDASGSMTGSPHAPSWFAAVRAAIAVVEASPPDTPVVMVVFTSRPMSVERGRTAVLSALRLLQTHVPTFEKLHDKQTAITDSIAAILSNAKAPPEGEIAYVLTDGGQNIEHSNMDRTIDGLVRSNIRLFSLVIKNGPPRTEEEKIGPDLMKKLADETGGQSAVFPSEQWKSQGDEKRLAEQQYAQIANFYELHFQTSQPLLKRTSWKLEVVDSSQQHSRGVKISYPHHLLPCSAVPTSPSNPAQN
jgi:hypothetical protein